MNSINIIKKLIPFFYVLMFLQLNFVIASVHSEPSDPPNIVVIIADDMGYSDLGCYGGEIKTPRIDWLAENGLRFTQFYNCGRCWPTRSSLLSGYYAQQVNLDGKRDAFPMWGYLLPHHLKRAGYRSYHSGKWHVFSVNTKLSGGGFDHSFDCTYTNNHHLSPREENLYLDDKSFAELPSESIRDNYNSATAIADYSIRFLKEHQQKYSDAPFFLYVAFISPHFPLQAFQKDIDKYRERYTEGWEKLKRERYERQRRMGFTIGENSGFEYHVTAPWSWPERYLKDSLPGEVRYARPWYELTQDEKYLQSIKMAIHAAMIDRIDQEVGRVLDQIKSMGVEENTLVLFLSDNGASAEQTIKGDGHDKNAPLGSSGSYLCLGPGFSTASNTPFRRHKFWTHEGGIATPLIAYWPRGIKDKGSLRYSMGHIIDFLPTFLELAGLDALDERNGYKAPPLPGKSMVPLFEDDLLPDRELYFSHRGNKALRQGKWKAVISSDIDGRWQLYNMEEDRTELNNLADDYRNNFGDPQWKQTNQQRLEQMKDRWEELDDLYQKQGKVGLK